jgi:glyoxylase I family protein
MSKPPKLTLHHVNLVSDDVARAEAFYRDVMGLERPARGLPRLEKARGYAGQVAFLSDGTIQHHLAEKDVEAGFRAGQIVNPVSHGHIAYRTEDMEAFLAHLDAMGVRWSDWGAQAVQGWRQVFFYDPDGNVIEVHEVAPGAET